MVLPAIDFLLKFWLIDSLLISLAGCSYVNTDMFKFKSSRLDDNKALSVYSTKTYRKPKTFN